jgi:Tol biopolymer transport system component
MPDWTSDARWMSQRRNDGDVYRIDVATGEEKLLHRAGQRIRNLQVSPDGAQLAFATAGRNQATLEVVDLAGAGTKSIALPSFVGWGGMIAWSPDSRLLVYGANDDKQSDLWVVPADGSSAPRKLLPGLKGRASQLAFSPDGKTLTYTRATSAQELWMLEGFLGEVRP